MFFLKKKISLRLHIGLIFVVVIWCTIFIIVGLNYIRYKESLIQLADQSMQRIYQRNFLQITNLLKAGTSIVDNIVEDPEQTLYAVNLPLEKRAFEIQEFISTILKDYDQYSGLYIGYENESYLSYRPATAEYLKKVGVPQEHLKSVDQTLLILNQDDPKKPSYRWAYHYKSKWLNGLEAPDQKFKEYKVTERQWYKNTIKRNSAGWEAQKFSGVGKERIGFIYSRPFYDKYGKRLGVVAINIALDKLLAYMNSVKFSPSAFMFIADQDHHLFAHSLVDISKLKKFPPKLEHIKMQRPNDIRFFNKMGATTASYSQVIDISSDPNQKLEVIGLSGSLKEAIGLDAKLYMGANLNDFTTFADGFITYTLKIVIIIAFALTIIIYFIARSLSKPIKSITENLHEIRSLKEDYEFNPKSSNIIEVEVLNHSTSLMNKSLKSFGRFVPIELIDILIKNNKAIEHGGKKTEITILFTDIANFTTISEESDEEALFNDLSEYFSIVTDIIHKHHGIIDKFIGDAVMAFWGAPIENPHQSYDACLSAIECKKAIDELNEFWEKHHKKSYKTRFGIYRGVAFVGNVGSMNRISYTALGNSVNVASRLEGLNKEENTSILISESVILAEPEIQDKFMIREVGLRSVKGKSEEVNVFELIDLK